MDKKANYSEEYLKFCFTSIVSSSIEKLQYVLCNIVLSAESNSKLKRHLETKHFNHVNTGLKFFGFKRQTLDFTGSVHQENASPTQASYKIAFEIAKNIKPSTIGKILVKLCLLKRVKTVLGESSEAKMSQISPSNDTIDRLILDMSDVRYI